MSMPRSQGVSYDINKCNGQNIYVWTYLKIPPKFKKTNDSFNPFRKHETKAIYAHPCS